MDIELIHKILSTKKVRFVEPDHFQFDFGTRIWAVEFDNLDTFQSALAKLCEHPDFTKQHLVELLEYLED